MCVRSRHLTIIESPSRILQRNCSQALAKLFSFNFLNYFHLNAYWIYVLGTTTTSINRAVATADLWMCHWMCAASETDTERRASERQQIDCKAREKRQTFFFVTLFPHFFDITLPMVRSEDLPGFFVYTMFADANEWIHAHVNDNKQWQTTISGRRLCPFVFSFLFFAITATLTSYQMTSDIVNHFFGPINFSSDGKSF